MNQTVDILCRARALYASAPSHAQWMEDIAPGTRCVIFAIQDATEGQWDRPAAAALRALGEAIGGDSDLVPAWNAEHSTAEVLGAFDRAIAAQRLVVPPLQRTGRRDPVHAGQES